MSPQEHTSKLSEPVSRRFNAKDADMIFRSSDGVLFKVYKRYTIQSPLAEGLAHEGLETAEITELSERENILDLLFQFLYPQPQPTLRGLSPSTMADLAEAVEKYRIFPAMSICRERMIDTARDQPLRALSYALKHGIKDLADSAALESLDATVESAMKTLCNDHFFRWVSYREMWLGAAKVTELPDIWPGHGLSDHNKTCSEWQSIRAHVLRRLHYDGLSAMRDVDEAFESVPDYACDCPEYTNKRPRRRTRCEASADIWRDRLKAAMHEIPSFHNVTYY